MLVLRLDDELEKRLAELAYRQGRNKSAIVREALIRYMEDQEDIEMAEAPLKNLLCTKVAAGLCAQYNLFMGVK